VGSAPWRKKAIAALRDLLSSAAVAIGRRRRVASTAPRGLRLQCLECTTRDVVRPASRRPHDLPRTRRGAFHPLDGPSSRQPRVELPHGAPITALRSYTDPPRPSADDRFADRTALTLSFVCSVPDEAAPVRHGGRSQPTKHATMAAVLVHNRLKVTLDPPINDLLSVRGKL
jgi:hypothetical protein